MRINILPSEKNQSCSVVNFSCFAGCVRSHRATLGIPRPLLRLGFRGSGRILRPLRRPRYDVVDLGHQWCTWSAAVARRHSCRVYLWMANCDRSSSPVLYWQLWAIRCHHLRTSKSFVKWLRQTKHNIRAKSKVVNCLLPNASRSLYECTMCLIYHWR